MRRFFITAAATAMSLSVASIAHADACDADAVLIQGSSASQAIIQALAPVAYALTPSVKIIYSSSGSSGGGISLMSGQSPPAGESATIFYLGGTPTTCTLGTPADIIGVSDVYPQSLAGVTASPFSALADPVVLDTDVTDTLGPVQAFTISVHDDPSFPVAISSDAAFNTFGITLLNGDSSFFVTPWTDPTMVFARAQSSGTWQTWSRNLGLPTNISQQNTTAVASSTGTVLAGLTSNAQATAIGIVAINDIISNQLNSPGTIQVRPLAYQAKDKGQDFAYYTSSTATATDMINVRDGHYQTWANLHFLAHKATAGDFSAPVKAILGLLDDQGGIAAAAKFRAIPQCAMQVSRSDDAGDFSAYAPTKPCGCFFEASAAGTAPATCKTCTVATDCGGTGSACNFGYCEAN